MGQGQGPHGSHTNALHGNGLGDAVEPRAVKTQRPYGGHLAAKPSVWHGSAQANVGGGQGAI
eukprot:2004424-Karenia_brevis.AAC.1